MRKNLELWIFRISDFFQKLTVPWNCSIGLGRSVEVMFDFAIFEMFAAKTTRLYNKKLEKKIKISQILGTGKNYFKKFKKKRKTLTIGSKNDRRRLGDIGSVVVAGVAGSSIGTHVRWWWRNAVLVWKL